MKTLEERIAALEDLEERITALEDIDKIKALQRTLGYYLDNRRYEDVIDLFSDNTESIQTDDTGIFLGKAGVRKFYETVAKPSKAMKSWLGIHAQLQGVVNLDPGGQTAHGRWQCLMLLAFPKPEAPNDNQAVWGAGVYENECIKENGTWKFKKYVLNHYFMTTFEEGWAKVPTLNLGGQSPDCGADIPATENRYYPSGYVLPYHFENPVTGK